MLVESNLKKGDVLAGKLITGEEIIARVDAVTDHTVRVKRPLTLNLVADPNTGQATVAPMPWSLGIADDAIITLGRDKFVFLTQARQEVVNSYTRATTGIDVAGMNSDVLKNLGGL